MTNFKIGDIVKYDKKVAICIDGWSTSNKKAVETSACGKVTSNSSGGVVIVDFGYLGVLPCSVEKLTLVKKVIIVIRGKNGR